MKMRVGLLAVAALILAGCQDNNPAPLAPTDQPAAPDFSTAHSQTIPGRYIVVFRRSVKDADKGALRLAGVHRGRLKHIFEPGGRVQPGPQ